MEREAMKRDPVGPPPPCDGDAEFFHGHAPPPVTLAPAPESPFKTILRVDANRVMEALADAIASLLGPRTAAPYDCGDFEDDEMMHEPLGTPLLMAAGASIAPSRWMPAPPRPSAPLTARPLAPPPPPPPIPVPPRHHPVVIGPRGDGAECTPPAVDRPGPGRRGIAGVTKWLAVGLLAALAARVVIPLAAKAARAIINAVDRERRLNRERRNKPPPPAAQSPVPSAYDVNWATDALMDAIASEYTERTSDYVAFDR